MPVVQTKTEPRCKVCKCVNRAEIETWLERRSRREKLPDGRMINLEFVVERARDLGLPSPTGENLKLHWQKHCERVDPEAAATEGEAFDKWVEREARALAEMFGEQGSASADSLPDRAIKVFDLWLLAQLKQGKLPRITWDQVRAMIDTKTRRRQNERVSDLLDMQAAALTGALGLFEGEVVGEIGPGGEPGGGVEDAEYAEWEGGGSGLGGESGAEDLEGVGEVVPVREGG